MFFILGLMLKYDVISYALGSTHWAFALWMLAFAILFTPISMIFWILWNMLSRKNEYEADRFAWENYSANELKFALTKLSRNNLSNLRPHWLFEFFHYSHPTTLKRLKALDEINWELKN
jgi:STE24 endopeptidase